MSDKRTVLQTHDISGLAGRFDPRMRLLATFCFAIAAVGFSSWQPLLVMIGLAVAIKSTSRPNWPRTLRMVMTMDGFIIVMLLMLPFSYPGTPLFTIFGFVASYEGFLRAILIALKANAVIFMVLALLGSLDAVTLGRALESLRIPNKLVQLFLFTVRYIDVLHREYLRLRLAMRARAFKLRSNMHTWRTIGYLFGMLLVRSYDRSERILAAMKCRGYDGRLHLGAMPALQARDVGFAVMMAFILGTIIWMEFLWPPLL
ncbi:cobalt ECF transporter T component CbiQ [Thalassospira sp.]|uniref:cobalt ECF transporter T component CbiQ n=1 Tax=Thalassospira sp. TaxID=1912094 RepID=UPI002736B089|nr:cobalt ECF transporter T component CbiQ [Thalassospira sp.]MDP2698000.1 cobalt ECF transporter T component CbiQ [Thalassospira sp.]